MASRSRERELARRRIERQLARRAELQARRRRRNAIIGSAVAVVLVLGGLGILVRALADNDDDAASAAATPKASASATSASGCTYTKAPGGKPARDVGIPAPTSAKGTGTVPVTLKTTQGDIVLSLDKAKAPCTVNSFVYLAQKKYFDQTPCHRVTDFGVLQCGDPTGSGSGGPGYQFADENLPKDATGVPYPRGTVAMANSGAGTNGSQFFIVYKDTELNGPNYSVLGTVTKGLEVVDKVGKAGSEPAGDGKPKLPISITSVATKAS